MPTFSELKIILQRSFPMLNHFKQSCILYIYEVDNQFRIGINNVYDLYNKLKYLKIL